MDMDDAPHEMAEEAEEAEQGKGTNKKIALLIAILALCLAVSETLGKNAQTTTLGQNIEAANLWAFFQGKTARMTTVIAQADAMETMIPLTADAEAKKVMQARVERWRKEAARYDDEAGDGRKQLSERAKAAEERRDLAEARHHKYELGSAAFQIAIVLSSAAIITGMAALAVGALSLGAIGIALTAIGLLAPLAMHFH
jgi:hypothetical protein